MKRRGLLKSIGILLLPIKPFTKRKKEGIIPIAILREAWLNYRKICQAAWDEYEKNRDSYGELYSKEIEEIQQEDDDVLYEANCKIVERNYDDRSLEAWGNYIKKVDKAARELDIIMMGSGKDASIITDSRYNELLNSSLQGSYWSEQMQRPG